MARTAPYILLAALCGALFFWRLGSMPLIGLDEGLYAECSREMLESGNYVVPTHNGEPFLEKPPVCYWLQAASMRAFGVSSFSARLPSAVAALLLVGLTAFIADRFYGRRAGLFAGFALATTMLTMGLARLCLLDQVFALTIAASLGAFLLSYTGLIPKWGYLAFWAAAGLSAMVKGPAGPVLIFGTVAVFLLVRGRAREFAGTMPLAGVLLFAAIALPWYVIVQKETGGAFVREFIMYHNLQRAIGGGFNHNMPFYYYLPAYLVGFFPWSVFAPLAVAQHVKLRPKRKADEASLFLAIWMGVVVVVCSLSRSKLPSYIFPAYPASAVLVGLMWSHAAETGRIASLRRYSVAAFVVAAAMIPAMLIGQRFLRTPIPGLGPVLLAMSISLAVGTALALVLMVMKRSTGAFAAACGGMAAFLLTAAWLGLPIVARVLADPAVDVARQIEASASPSDRVIAYALSPPQPGIAFYAKRFIHSESTPGDLRKALNSGKTSLVVAQVERLRELPAGGSLQGRVGPYVFYRYGR